MMRRRSTESRLVSGKDEPEGGSTGNSSSLSIPHDRNAVEYSLPERRAFEITNPGTAGLRSRVPIRTMADRVADPESSNEGGSGNSSHTYVRIVSHNPRYIQHFYFTHPRYPGSDFPFRRPPGPRLPAFPHLSHPAHPYHGSPTHPGFAPPSPPPHHPSRLIGVYPGMGPPPLRMSIPFNPPPRRFPLHEIGFFPFRKSHPSPLQPINIPHDPLIYNDSPPPTHGNPDVLPHRGPSPIPSKYYGGPVISPGPTHRVTPRGPGFSTGIYHAIQSGPDISHQSFHGIPFVPTISHNIQSRPFVNLGKKYQGIPSVNIRKYQGILSGSPLNFRKYQGTQSGPSNHLNKYLGILSRPSENTGKYHGVWPDGPNNVGKYHRHTANHGSGPSFNREKYHGGRPNMPSVNFGKYHALQSHGPVVNPRKFHDSRTYEPAANANKYSPIRSNAKYFAGGANANAFGPGNDVQKYQFGHSPFNQNMINWRKYAGHWPNAWIPFSR